MSDRVTGAQKYTTEYQKKKNTSTFHSSSGDGKCILRRE
jgi:hypothetical protein